MGMSWETYQANQRYIRAMMVLGLTIELSTKDKETLVMLLNMQRLKERELSLMAQERELAPLKEQAAMHRKKKIVKKKGKKKK